MVYDRNNYLGQYIQLYPGDYNSKWGRVESVDDLGWGIRITKVTKPGDPYNVGDVIFISHSKAFTFTFVSESTATEKFL